MKTIAMQTASKSYEIKVGKGLLDMAGSLAAQVRTPEKAMIVTDSTVDRLYSGRLISSLEGAGFDTVKYVFPAGERSKNSETLLELLNFMARSRMTRADTLFALGGGVTGDLGGLAAALYMRGIGLVQVPTTLLACVDSSIGGKTAIDLEAGKNLAGVFYQPELVICDSETLLSLPESEYSNGCAEVIKYAMIKDPSLSQALCAPEKAGIDRIITRCVQIKGDVVSADERETGERRILNFGHTFGHAIEKCSGYAIPHGSAVAVGMSLITNACVKLGLCEQSCLSKLRDMLERCKLPSETEFSEKELFEAVLSDKKRASDRITLVVPREVGNCELSDVPLSQARQFLRLGLGV